jgi:hypothetical protein
MFEFDQSKQYPSHVHCAILAERQFSATTEILDAVPIPVLSKPVASKVAIQCCIASGTSSHVQWLLCDQCHLSLSDCLLPATRCQVYLLSAAAAKQQLLW